ncbi:MAG: cold-shock protein [gamma proteobacterium symbiont of Bathyaustriella thionipta]|nr:cold-shock protein [gamma proteobacterium symbiont of Bathyaustriella thionipta]MCU7949437.1 cold-shock protein [gamma proteobacterium symbiont of Bathyaustriella thionipta]MCU7954039.1 cold-shock protein [gamma proteobacterium symbiont of Bathyaustriella thionipta]MCU7956024.1 cold-shock protein [gamma proteobacterium symbiont of Bathyaustriella thionipta]MCU7966228.1 cold-shock protein [gamma proteobacterium symbiont of Bathyaustriella thionipta]
MLLLQSIKTQSITKYFTDRKAARAAAKQVSQSVSDPNRETGTVKWFDSNKGYGFITRSMGEDIFVHFRSIKGNGYRSLYEGQSVEFLVTNGTKGPQAEDIHIVK